MVYYRIKNSHIREDLFDWVLEAKVDLEKTKRHYEWSDYSMTCFCLNKLLKRL